jgi:ketosteroid isomerase-like protein
MIWVLLVISVTMVLAGTGPDKADADAERAVRALLDDFHHAAREADGERFFGYLTPDAILFGTDKTERWTIEAYKAFIEPHLARGVGWSGKVTARNVFVSPDGKAAWFDERIDKPGFGEGRATGVLVRIDGSWKVAQYNFSFTVPNEVARDLAAMILELEADGR